MELNSHPELRPEPLTPAAEPAPAAGAPDPQAVRRLPVPDCAPPLDDAGGAAPSPEPPSPEPPSPAPSTRPAAVATSPDPPTTAPTPQPADSGLPGGWPSQFAQILAETLAGSRPPQQLRSWTTEQTRSRIRQLGPMLSTGQQPRVRRIMASAPSADVVEMTAVVGFGSRARVLALRLERTDDCHQRWRCTAIEAA